jgi:hypothetical protein
VLSTSIEPTHPSDADSPERVPLRLRMTGQPGEDHLDGGWWPQSRNLEVELADLVDHFPPRYGRIVRALFSPPDWGPAPRRIRVGQGYVKVGPFPRDDTHLVRLTTTGRVALDILVVPPGFTEAQGSEALLAAGTRGNKHSAVALLEEVTDHYDVDPRDQWTDHAEPGPARVSSSRRGSGRAGSS